MPTQSCGEPQNAPEDTGRTEMAMGFDLLCALRALWLIFQEHIELRAQSAYTSQFALFDL